MTIVAAVLVPAAGASLVLVGAFSTSGGSSSSSRAGGFTGRNPTPGRILRTEVDADGDAEDDGETRTGAPSRTASEHATAPGIARGSSSAASSSKGPGRTSTHSAFVKPSRSAAVEMQKAQMLHQRRDGARAYAIRGWPDDPNPFQDEASHCGADGTATAIDKATRLGTRCCGTEGEVPGPEREVPGSGSFPADPWNFAEVGGNKVDCVTPADSNGGNQLCTDESARDTWDESAATCETLGRRLCTREEVALPRVLVIVEAANGDASGCWQKFPNADETLSYASCPNAADNVRVWNPDPSSVPTSDLLSFSVRVLAGVTSLKVEATFATESTNTVEDPQGSSNNAKYKDDSLYATWDDGNVATFHADGNSMDGVDGSFKEIVNMTAYNDENGVNLVSASAGPAGLTEGMHNLKLYLREDGLQIGRLRLNATGGVAHFVQGDGGRQICHGTGGSCDSHCIWTADEYVETATASDEDAEASEEEGEEGSSAASTPLVVAGVAVALAAAVAVATKLGGSTPGAAAGEGEGEGGDGDAGDPGGKRDDDADTDEE